MSDHVEVRPLLADDAERCAGIIASLPHFFGDPTGIRDCAAAVRSQQGFVATVGGEVKAFLTPHRSAIEWERLRAACMALTVEEPRWHELRLSASSFQ